MRILVVEDEPKIAAAIKRGLEQETFSVDVVHDGDSGYSYGKSDEYDAIVLDWMIPGKLDGRKMCEKLRSEDITTPILMLTARGSTESKIIGLNSGADDYLAKPFSFDELVARLRALLRRPAGVINNRLSVADLTLDSTAKSVQRGGLNISVTAKEYALLEYLMRRNGHVVSKDTIIQHVWSDDDDILPNTVEVYIGYLRNKIDKPSPRTVTS